MTVKTSTRSIPNNNVDGEVNKQDLPSDVNSKEQLSLLPIKYLSDDPKRPLLLRTDGIDYKYALRPIFYSALAILIIELFERLSFYTITNTETEFLTGSYALESNPNFTPNLQPAQASMFTQWSTIIAYISPFIGGIAADGFLGDYYGIIVGVSAFYLPGLFLIALTTIPGVLGSTFNMAALKAGMLGLMPLGTGFIKSLVNVFGAKQFHPILQVQQIASYYTNFYIVINIGALIAGFVAPILAQIDIRIAYFIPFVAMTIGFIIFLAFSSRYVRRPPEKKALFNTLTLVCKRVGCCKKFDDSKQSNGGELSDTFVDGVKRLLMVFPVTLLILPFSIVYNQMNTVFILQGQAMKAAGYFDASSMNIFDTLACILAGIVLGSFIYPALANRGIHVPVTYKFAIGSMFATLAIVAGIIIDAAIKDSWKNGEKQISVFYLGISYFLVGMGEVLTNSASYDAAFQIAPKEQKGLASAINLFMMGSLPGFVCNGIMKGVEGWFPQVPIGATSTQRTEAYVNSELSNYFWILFGIVLVFGVFFNLLPPVKNWVEDVVSDALDATAMEFSSDGDDDDDDETTDKAIENSEEGGSESSTTANEEDSDGDNNHEVMMEMETIKIN